jgi:DNA-binding SARP family transcriptional activator
MREATAPMPAPASGFMRLALATQRGERIEPGPAIAPLPAAELQPAPAPSTSALSTPALSTPALSTPALSTPALSTPALSIYLLGSLRVFAEDQPLADAGQGKGRAVFKFLALHVGEPVAKEVLMDLFWPGAAPAAARNCLHVALHGLRKSLATALPSGEVVQFRQGAYRLNPSHRPWVDTEAFAGELRRAEGAECRGDRANAGRHYRAAKALYRGPLLVEDRYEGWLVPHRQRLRGAYLAALERLAAFALADGDEAGCIAFTQSLLDDDPCNEAAHRQLMQCYARTGQAHLALWQFHHCVDVLARELDLIPSAQTVALFHHIRKRLPV